MNTGYIFTLAIIFQGYLRAFGFFAKVLGLSPNEVENYQGSVRRIRNLTVLKKERL